MKNKIKKAVEANDIPKIRLLLIELMATRAGKTSVLMEISETISSVPGLFEKDNGKTYPSAIDLTPEGLERLRLDLADNFSLPKYRLFTEANARMQRDPDFQLHSPIPKKETLEGILATPEEPKDSIPRNKPLLIVGFILMILGAVTSIVGLCVPVRFMIGLGIGVILLGAATAYAALPRS